MRLVTFLRLRGDAVRDVDAVEAWLSAGDPAPVVIATSGSSGAPKSVVLSRDAVLASAAASAARARRVRAAGCSRSRRRTSPGCRWSCRSVVAGHRPTVLGDDALADVVPEGGFLSAGADAAAPVARLATGRARRWPASTPSCVGGGPVDPALRRARPRPESGCVATYGIGETCGGCVYDGLPLDGVGPRAGRRRADPADGPDALRRATSTTRRPAARRCADGWFVHLRRRPARRGRPAAACSAGSTTWWSAAASTCRPRPSRRGLPRASRRRRGRGRRACPTRVGRPAWSPFCVGRADSSVELRALTLDDARAWVADGTREPGRPASWSSSTSCRCCPTARSTAGRPELAAGGGPMRVFSIPMPPGSVASPCARALLLEGAAGWGEWSPFLEYAAEEVDALAALCARRRPRATGPTAVRDAVPVNVTVPAVAPASSAALIVRARGLPRPPRSRWPSRGRRLADDLDRVEAVRDALGPAGRLRVDANGGLVGRRRGGRDRRAGPGRRRAGVRRAAVRARSRTSPLYDAGSTCRSPPTSRSAAPPTPTACATSRPPTSPCSRCSRSAACAPACGSPRRSGCPSSCRRRWRPRSGIAAGVALAAALPRLDHACGLATGQLLTADVAVAEPLLPVDGDAAGAPARGRRTGARWTRVAASPDRVACWEDRLAGRAAPCGRIARS